MKSSISVPVAVLALPSGKMVVLKVGDTRDLGRIDHAQRSAFVSKKQCQVIATADGLQLTTLSTRTHTVLLREGKKPPIKVMPGQTYPIQIGDKIGLHGTTASGLVCINPPSATAQGIPGAISLSNVPLEPHWRSAGNKLIYWEGGRREGKVAAFDFDGTLAYTSHGGPARKKEDYIFLTQAMIQKMVDLDAKGYALVIFTNQSGIGSKHQGNRAARVKWGLREAIRLIGLPFDVYIATQKDEYRKGFGIAMWARMCTTLKKRSGKDVRKAESFFVGDAAGRPADFSDSDRVFAQSIGIKFYTPNEFFGSIPRNAGSGGKVQLVRKAMRGSGGDAELARLKSRRYKGQVVVILCGPQGAGKTTFAKRVMRVAPPNSWRWINQDTIKRGKKGNRRMCMKSLMDAIQQNQSVLLDRMHLTPDQREPFLKICADAKVTCHCVVLLPPANVCVKRVRLRQDHPTLKGPKAAFYSRQSHAKLQPPKYSEGFSLVSLCESDDEADRLGMLYALILPSENRLNQSRKSSNLSSKLPNPPNPPEKEDQKKSTADVSGSINVSGPNRVEEKLSLARLTADARKRKRPASGDLGVSSKMPRSSPASSSSNKRHLVSDEALSKSLQNEEINQQDGKTSNMEADEAFDRMKADEAFARQLQAEINAMVDEERGMNPAHHIQENKLSSSPQNSTTNVKPGRDGIGEFRLLRVHKHFGLGAKAEEMSIGLREMVGADRSKPSPEWVIITNYMVDVDWLLQEWPELVSIPKVILFHGQREDLQNKRLPSSFSSHLMLPEQTHGIRYGVFHTKSFIIGFPGEVRIVVHSANLIPQDFNTKSQGTWMQDFPLKTLESSRSPFEEDLLTYMETYEVRWKGSEWKDPKTKEIRRLSVSTLRDYDYSKAKVRLIGSAPGRHTGSAMRKFGHLKLKAILSSMSFDEKFSKGPLVMQFSSMGSLNEKWLRSFQESLSSGKKHSVDGGGNARPKGALGRGEIKIIWPTIEEIRTSITGYAAGGSVPGPEKNVTRKFLQQYYHVWGTDTVHDRRRVSPHIKTFLRYQHAVDSQRKCQEIAWVLLTSHNLSQAAWGVEQKGRFGPQLFIRHWELGVLFIPTASGGISQITTTACTPAPSRKRIPLPYALPPRRYGAGDVPWIWTKQKFPLPDIFGRQNYWDDAQS
uniref:PNK FHA domain-containing protein n=1 Tax=Amorphochlora amoebiformis TaxID=1561963 RepID=A0A7S0GYA7_9EUKA|mmetsp:Transcript_26552/g.42094  ORF Transcript_26552/g.42094 Transcript_26552/m.42094 type:complete len:1160 (+) Transcript_26552:1-3480(+)